MFTIIRRRALLLALGVTAFVMPLAMFVAHAPTGQDAAGRFRQAELSPSDVGMCLGASVMLFCVAFVFAGTALSRRAGKQKIN